MLSAEHVAKAGAVAEGFEPVSKRCAVRSVPRARHVAHVGLPAARVATALQPGPAPPANRWGVLVTIETPRVGISCSTRSRRPSAPRRLTTSRRGQPRRTAPRKCRRTLGDFWGLNMMRCTPLGLTHSAGPASVAIVGAGTQTRPVRIRAAAMIGVRMASCPGTPRQAVAVSIIDFTIMSRAPPCEGRPQRAQEI
jgi:hypothetical protein